MTIERTQHILCQCVTLLRSFSKTAYYPPRCDFTTGNFTIMFIIIITKKYITSYSLHT